MPIVVDASLIVLLITRDQRAAGIDRQVRSWLDAGQGLHAPSLFTYEVASALTRLAAAGRLSPEAVSEAWTTLDDIQIMLHPPGDGRQLTSTALLLGRRSAYDAAYLVLARQLGAELWTVDGPLARNASGLGFPVYLVE